MHAVAHAVGDGMNPVTLTRSEALQWMTVAKWAACDLRSISAAWALEDVEQRLATKAPAADLHELGRLLRRGAMRAATIQPVILLRAELFAAAVLLAVED